jgi:hypothetical protein
MLTLSLCQKVCPNLIPPNVGESLGDGSDGQVFELTSDINKVIKISLLSCLIGDNLDLEYSRIEKSLHYLKENNDSLYAHLYTYECLGKYSRIIFNDRISLGEEQEYILYSYVMEKCFELSQHEKNIFLSLMDAGDENFIKNCTPAQIKNILTGLDGDVEKVILFFDNLKKSPLRHLDIHVRNIMKSESGDFKLIDFDQTKLE